MRTGIVCVSPLWRTESPAIGRGRRLRQKCSDRAAADDRDVLPRTGVHFIFHPDPSFQSRVMIYSVKMDSLRGRARTRSFTPEPPGWNPALGIRCELRYAAH